MTFDEQVTTLCQRGLVGDGHTSMRTDGFDELQRYAWVATEVAGPSARVTAVRALGGGTHANTSLVQTENPEREIVLREFPAGDDAAEREARVLGALGGLNGLAPRLLASAGSGPARERPRVLISRLPGQANITPADPRAWAAELGRALARIHATPLQRVSGFESVFERSRGLSRTSRGRPPATSQLGRNAFVARLQC